MRTVTLALCFGLLGLVPLLRAQPASLLDQAQAVQQGRLGPEARLILVRCLPFGRYHEGQGNLVWFNARSMAGFATQPAPTDCSFAVADTALYAHLLEPFRQPAADPLLYPPDSSIAGCQALITYNDLEPYAALVFYQPGGAPVLLNVTGEGHVYFDGSLALVAPRQFQAVRQLCGRCTQP